MSSDKTRRFAKNWIIVRQTAMMLWQRGGVRQIEPLSDRMRTNCVRGRLYSDCAGFPAFKSRF